MHDTSIISGNPESSVMVSNKMSYMVKQRSTERKDRSIPASSRDMMSQSRGSEAFLKADETQSNIRQSMTSSIAGMQLGRSASQSSGKRGARIRINSQDRFRTDLDGNGIADNIASPLFDQEKQNPEDQSSNQSLRVRSKVSNSELGVSDDEGSQAEEFAQE